MKVEVVPANAYIVCKWFRSSTESFDDAVEIKGATKESYTLTKADLGTLKNIPSRTFLNCISLDNALISDSVQEVGAHAFRGCLKLKTINIGKNVKSVGESAFAQCDALKTVKYGGSESNFAKIKFEIDNDLLKAVL